MFNSYLEGKGAKEIGNLLNSEGLKTPASRGWSKNSVHYILRNEVYSGALVWNRREKSLGRTPSRNPTKVIRIENNHPAIVDKDTFDRVQELLKSRRPRITHPRALASRYLLSGLVYCGRCKAKMIGSAAKSSRFFYYACQNYCKRGKAVCSAAMINKEKLESFIIERLKTRILTERNLKELVRMVNEEIRACLKEDGDRLAQVEAQLKDLRARLQRHYLALETGKLDVDDLAPRIKELKSRIDELEVTRAVIRGEREDARFKPVDSSRIKGYVEDLRNLLSQGAITEQKSFLRSFVKRIEIYPPKVTLDYTLPLSEGSLPCVESEVLSIDKAGSPDWTMLITNHGALEVVWNRSGNGTMFELFSREASTKRSRFLHMVFPPEHKPPVK